MPNNWKTYKLSDFIDINPLVKLKANQSYSFVEMKDLDANLKTVRPSDFKTLKGGAKFQNNDTLFARITPCLENGKICQVRDLENNVGFGSTEFLVFRGKENISDSDFVYYLSREPFVRQFAEANMIGTSGRQRVAKEAFQNIELELPPVQEQKSIASILSAIDDKIENNLAINKTLEEMAMALYKHWFVDFGPFQDGEFVDSEIFGINNSVSIPKNFKILNIKEEIIRLKPKNKYTQDNILKLGKIRVYDQSSARILGFHNNEPDFNADFENPLLIFGDHTCRMELICENFSVGPNLIPFKTNIKDYTYLVYLALKDKVKMNDYKRHWSELMLHQFVVPNEIHLLDDFNNLVKEFFNLINKNELENQTLTQLRDTLLPKLISGEVRLKGFREESITN